MIIFRSLPIEAMMALCQIFGHAVSSCMQSLQDIYHSKIEIMLFFIRRYIKEDNVTMGIENQLLRYINSRT